MFDHNDSIAQIHQALEHVEQPLDVFEVQPGGRLIQDVERAAGLALAQFARQLDALRFAAGKRGGRLAQVNVAQAHIVQRLQLGVNLRNIFEHRERVFHGRFQQIGDRKPLVFHLQRFAVVAAAVGKRRR